MPSAESGGSLGIGATRAARPLLDDWIPRRHPLATRARSLPRARILVRATSVAARSGDDGARAAPHGTLAGPARPALLHLRGMEAFRESPHVVTMHTPTGATGRVELSRLTARLTLPLPGAARHSAESYAIHAMLTVSAALLLGRLGAALVHGAGVVDPAGRAWLLVGDTHAGKSTTCTSLVAHGWRFLADDQVILHERRDGALALTGWPRRAHLDRGWEAGRVTGAREEVDLTARWASRWVARAPLAGVIVPGVRAGGVTYAEPLGAAAALEALVRQSPWLLADPSVARPQLALLAQAAALPARRLVLAADSYARGDVLERVLAGR